jgi:prophage antirepressor-like protein
MEAAILSLESGEVNTLVLVSFSTSHVLMVKSADPEARRVKSWVVDAD